MSKHESGFSHEQNQNILTPSGVDAIRLRADSRRRSQELRVNKMNLQQPWATEAMKGNYDAALARVNREAAGEEAETTPLKEIPKQAALLSQKAAANAEIFPDLAAYHSALAAKLKLAGNLDPRPDIETAKKYSAANTAKLKVVPSSLLPDAIILGVQKKISDKLVLPGPEATAKAVLSNGKLDKKLLRDYAMVLAEKDRPDFLSFIPDGQRRKVAIILDESVSKVLHQSIIDKESDENKQRKEVRLRSFYELKTVLADNKESDKQIAGALARALGRLGGDARLLLLELARDEMENKSLAKEKEQEYLPHVLGVLMKEFDDWRVNDVALQMVGDATAPSPVRRNLLHQLVKRNYLPEDVGQWWTESNDKIKNKKNLAGDWDRRLDLLHKVIGDLGVPPNKEILEFLEDDKRWKKISLDQRVEKIRQSQEKFAHVETQKELVEILNGDENSAMIYYLLHGGEDRFNLINNYPFDKFKEMLKLISDLKVHEKPMERFEAALEKSGMRKNQIKEITDRLRAGHYPLANAEQARQTVGFEVSENAAVKNANAEIGRALGREQLGVVMLFPAYREYLEKDDSKLAKKLFKEMSGAKTLADRLAVINEIEKSFPKMREKAKNDLSDNWRMLGEKMVLEITLDQVFGENSLLLRGEELIPRLNSKRLDLKKMKKDFLVALKGGNEKLESLRNEIYKNKKARAGLALGVEKQEDGGQRERLKIKVEQLDQKIAELEKQKDVLSDSKVSERFAHLSKDDKEKEIDKISREIIALTEKSPSAIFTYMTMQVLGEDRLSEQDVELVKELESHLQGPFQTISDHLNYHPAANSDKKSSAQVVLQYVDKADRLMNMVRFADSKICCFSSSNYEMRVQHETPNKYWVASINADPLSFVVSIETPKGEAPAEAKKAAATENLGFIFGSFALNEKGELAIMDNGIYYAPGLDNSEQVEAILAGLDRIFTGLPVKTNAIASQHGGSIKLPDGYSNSPVEFTRLRALDDNSGDQETKIYDDIGTGSDLNKKKVYNQGGGGSLWHKRKA